MARFASGGERGRGGGHAGGVGGGEDCARFAGARVREGIRDCEVSAFAGSPSCGCVPVGACVSSSWRSPGPVSSGLCLGPVSLALCLWPCVFRPVSPGLCFRARTLCFSAGGVGPCVSRRGGAGSRVFGAVEPDVERHPDLRSWETPTFTHSAEGRSARGPGVRVSAGGPDASRLLAGEPREGDVGPCVFRRGGVGPCVFSRVPCVLALCL